MADRGFNIQDDLIPLGVRVNIPPFLKGKTQLEAKELVETRHIASLRIHVERAMEQIKNYHIFNRTLPSSLTDLAEETFFVCAVMSNFLPPLCTYVGITYLLLWINSITIIHTIVYRISGSI